MKLIKRKLYEIIDNKLFKGKAIILVGARQVGKSTLFRQIVENKNNVLNLNCDDPTVRATLQDINLNTLKQLIGNNKIVVIDEAQRIQGIGLTLKLITDNLPDVQLLVSGSSSFLLQGQHNEPLTGRKFEYHLYPISTEEIFNDGGLISTKQSLESRLIYGSYPDVINNIDNPHDILINLSGSYMYQDLLSMEGIRKPVIIEKLLIALALQVGSEISYNEISQTIGTDSKTVEKYIDLLEKCYIVFRMPALSRNLRNELKKSKKIYFYDNGIRNSIIQNFNPLALRNDVGALWENFFISERIKYNQYNQNYCNTYFWRTTEQQEIDYIEESSGKFTLFEMKWNPKKSKISVPKPFVKAYGEHDFHIITPDNYLDFLILR